MWPPRMKRCAVLVLASLHVGSALAADETDPDATTGAGSSADAATTDASAAGTAAEPRYSIIQPLAAKSLLLDAARAGARMVVVGERGHVLTSDDQGKSWKQSKVPARATLTGVYFADELHGWAVGHDEVIVRTQDGGVTWELTHSAPEKEQPLLDVWFKDRNNGLAIGAYGTMLASSDGGRTWQPRTFEPQPLVAASAKPQAPAPEEEDEYSDATLASDVHLNAIVPAPGGGTYIAGEAGNLYRSDDEGQTWRTLPSPYEGSFFGILPLDERSLLAFGLRGNLFRSDDQGATWSRLETGTEAMITDGRKVDDSTVVLSGLAGTLLVSEGGATTFELLQQADRKGNASLLPIDARRFVVVGEGGVRTIAR